MQDANTAQSYNIVSKLLHWLVALTVIIMLCIGLSFNYVTNDSIFSILMFTHKSLGQTLLLLMILRILWRFTHPRPAYPATMKTWEQVAADTNHYLLYIFVTLMPISGLVMSSASGYASPFWGLFNVKLPIAKSKAISGLFGDIHLAIAWTITALLILHLLAVIKHQFIDKDNILKRML